MSGEIALALKDVTVRFERDPRVAPALDAVSVSVPRGSTLGIVGESGSGKSTMAKAIVGINPLVSGSIHLADEEISTAHGRRLWQIRRRIQLIPQNPYSSLNPRRTVGAAIAEAIDPYGRTPRRRLREQIVHWLEMVRLPADAYHRYPHEFSGGQRQRIAIARALAIRPEIVIADEITSALDATVQKEILALIARLRAELGFTMLFVSHNLAVVQEVSDDLLVLLRGVVVEQGPCAQIFSSPENDYTRTLLSSIPGLPGFSLR